MTLKVQHSLTTFISFWTVGAIGMLSSYQSYAMGSPRAEDPVAVTPVTPAPVTPTPPAGKRSFDVHGLVTVQTNYDLGTMSLPTLKPACLKSSGFDLIALDPGHDDTSASRRSDAKVRGGNGKYVFLWPKVHEGQLNMVTSLLVAHYMLSNPALSAAEKRELTQMIRLSRYPGERRFGDYELEEGYISSSVGSIDDTVTNRRNRVNQMIRSHRKYSSSNAKGWASAVSNVQERAMFVSVHANSTDYFDEGDFGWVIPPNTTSIGTLTSAFQTALAQGFGSQMLAALTPKSSDDRDIFNLKNAIYKNYETSKVRKTKHSTNLAMLSTSLGTAKTLKVLSEGFVMNGKAGHIAHLELNASSPRAMRVFRGSTQVQEYGVSSVYDGYAKSLVLGIANQVKCN